MSRDWKQAGSLWRIISLSVSPAFFARTFALAAAAFLARAVRCSGVIPNRCQHRAPILQPESPDYCERRTRLS